MPQETLYTQILDLDSLDVYLETPTNDESYFSVRGLPEQIGFGKHFFTLTYKDPPNQPLLATNSSIVFEFVDSNGTVVFSQLADIDDVSGAATGYIWIKEDPLRTAENIFDGELTMYVVGTVEGVPSEYEGRRNLRSSFTFEIRKNQPNLSPIMLYDPRGAIISASFSESLEQDVKPGYSRGYINISASHLQTQGGKIKFAELSYRETGSRSTDFNLLNTFELDNDDARFEVDASGSQGLNPISTRFKTPIPKEIRRDTPVIFKLRYLDENKTPAQFYDENKLNEQIVITSSVIQVNGSPIIIEREDNLLKGSMFTGNAVGKGFEQSGKNSAFLKTVDYTGFISASTHSGSPGVMFFSGSVLPDSGDEYQGVGLELVGDSESFFRFRSDPSVLDIRTKKFFVGSEATQFISASGGNIEISSSHFHLEPDGNVSFSGSIDASSGRIGGFKISSSRIHSNNEDLILKANGQISASAILLASSSFVIDPNNLSRFGSDGFGSFVMADDTGVKIQTSDFNLNTARFIISSSDVGVMAMGSNPPTAFDSGKGIYMSGDGNFLAGDSDGERIQFNGFNLVMSSSAFFLGNTDSFMSGSNGAIRISGSDIEIQTPRFLFGNSVQFISGSNGNLEITSSNFHLDVNGNVKLIGRIEATSGFLGGFGITTDAITGSNIIISGSPLIGGVDDPRYMFISSSNFNVKENGDITGSSALFDGNIDVTGTGTIGGFVLNSSEIRSSNNNLRLKSSGQITGSNVLFNGGKISGSAIDVIVPKFFLGSETQFVSGSNGNIEISSSNFHLDNTGNVTMAGTVTATTGEIGGFNIGKGALSSTNFFISGAASGTQLFISSSGFSVDAQGVVSASDLSLQGGSVGGLSVAEGTISVGEILKLKDSGQITGSNVLFTGGKIAAFNLSKDALSTNNFFISASATGQDLFISSSEFKVRATGEITGSTVLLTGGKIAGWTIDGTTLTGNNATLDGAGSALFKSDAGPDTDNSAGTDELRNEYYIDFTPEGQGNTRNFFVKFGPNFMVDSDGILIASGAKFVGTITASAGLIGGFTTDSSSLRSSNIFISGSPLQGGVHDPRYMFISSSNFNIKESGDITGSSALFDGNIDVTGTGTIGGFVLDSSEIRSSNNNLRLKSGGNITGSQVLFTGGTIGGFELAASQINSTNDNLILKSSGQITGSEVLFTGGRLANFTIDGHSLTTTGVEINDSSQTLFISSSNFKVKHTGEITGSRVLFSAGKIAGWTIDGDVLSAGNVSLTGGSAASIKLGNLLNATGTGTTRKGFMADNDGNVLIKGSTSGNNYIKVDASGGSIDIKSEIFDLDAGTLILDSATNSGKIALGGTPPTSITTNEGFYADGTGDVLIGDADGQRISFDGSNLVMSSSTFFLGNETNFISGSTGNIKIQSSGETTLSGSGVNILTPQFFFGKKSTAFISGSTGNIEISASSFHLDRNGNVTMSGSIVAADGQIGGFTINPNTITATNFTLDPSNKFISLGSGDDVFIADADTGIQLGDSTFADAPFSVTPKGFVKATTGAIGGFGITSTEISSSNNNIKLKSSGQITGSNVLFTGGKIAGFNISGNTLVSTDSNFTLDSSNRKISLGSSNNVFIADADDGIQLGHATFSSAPFSVTKGGVLKATSGTIGGWNLSSDRIFSDNVNITSTGTIETSDFASGVKGWRISALNNGTAEFENAVIRGTMKTAVFEKETVNAVGGQLYVANSTVLTGSGQISASHTTMSVVNVSGFTGSYGIGGEILSLKKVTETGFSTEYVLVQSASRDDRSSDTNFAGKLYVVRGYSSGSVGASGSLGGTPNNSQSYEPGQVIVSTGRQGTGFIRINAKPTDTATPYIDIVERTGSGIYDVELKARLGDLSGLSSAQVGTATGSFGLFTERAFLTKDVTVGTLNSEHIKIDSTSLRFIDNTTTMAELRGSTWTIGGAHGDTSDTVVIDGDGVTIFGNDSSTGVFVTDNAVAIKADGDADKVTLGNSGMTVTTDSVDVATFGANTVIKGGTITLQGTTGGGDDDRIVIGNANIEMYTNDSKVIDIVDGKISLGPSANAGATNGAVIGNIHLASAGAFIYGAATDDFVNVKSDGVDVVAAGTNQAFFGATSRIGDVANEHISMSSAGFFIKDGGTQLGKFVAKGATLGVTTGAHISASTTDINIISDSNNFAKLDSDSLDITVGGNQVATFGANPIITGGTVTIRNHTNNNDKVVISADKFEVFDNNNVVATFAANTVIEGGTVTIRNTTNNNDKVVIAQDSFKVFDNNTQVGSFGAVTAIGDVANEHISMSSDGVILKDGGTQLGKFASTTTIGDTSTEHVEITSTSFKLKDGSTERLVMNSDGIAMGSQFSVDSSGNASFSGTLSIGSLPAGTVSGSAQLAAEISGATVIPEGIISGAAQIADQISGSSNALSASTSTLNTNVTADSASVASSLTATAADSASVAAAIRLTSTGMDILNDSGNKLAEYGSDVFIGLQNAEHVKISTSGLELKDNTTVLGKFASTTTIGNTDTEHVEITSTSFKLKDGGTTRLEMNSSGISMGSQFSVDASGNASFSGTLSVGSLPAGTVSGSAQLAAEISGATVIPEGTVSGSAQLAAQISGSSNALSASTSTLSTNVAADSASVAASITATAADSASVAAAIRLTSTGLDILNDSGNKLAEYGSNVFVGLQNAEHVKIGSAGLELKDNTVLVGKFSTHGATLGKTNVAHISASTTEINVIKDANNKAVLGSGGLIISQSGDGVAKFAGTTTIGITNAEHLLLNTDGLTIKDGTTTRASLLNDGITLNGASTDDQLVVNSSGLQLKEGGNVRATLAGDTLTLGKSGEARTVITDTGIDLYSGQATPRRKVALNNAGVAVFGGALNADVSFTSTDDVVRITPGSGVSIFEDSNNFAVVNSSGLTITQSGAGVAQFASTTTIGNRASEHLLLNTSGLAVKDGTTVVSKFSSHGAVLGNTSNAHISASTTDLNLIFDANNKAVLDSDSLDFTIGGNQVATFGANTIIEGGTITIRNSTNNNDKVVISEDSFQVFDNNNAVASFGANTVIEGGTITLRNTTNNNDKVVISQDSFKVFDNNTQVGSFGAITAVGDVANEHISMSSTGVVIKDGTNVNTLINGSGATIGNPVGNAHISMSTNDISIITGSNRAVLKTSGLEVTQSNVGYAKFASTTTIGNTATEHVEITSTTFKLKDGSTDRLVMNSDGIAMGNQFSVDSSGNASFSGTLSIGSLPAGTVSGSAQLAAEISGATVIPEGTVSGSAQLAAQISGSSNALSASTSTLNTNVTADSASVAAAIRLTSTGMDVLDGSGNALSQFSDTVIIGEDANDKSRMVLDSDSLDLIVDAGGTDTTHASFGATTTIGDTSGEHIKIDSTAFSIKTDANTTVLSASSAGLFMSGSIAAGAGTIGPYDIDTTSLRRHAKDGTFNITSSLTANQFLLHANTASNHTDARYQFDVSADDSNGIGMAFLSKDDVGTGTLDIDMKGDTKQFRLKTQLDASSFAADVIVASRPDRSLTEMVMSSGRNNLVSLNNSSHPHIFTNSNKFGKQGFAMAQSGSHGTDPMAVGGDAFYLHMGTVSESRASNKSPIAADYVQFEGNIPGMTANSGRMSAAFSRHTTMQMFQHNHYDDHGTSTVYLPWGSTVEGSGVTSSTVFVAPFYMRLEAVVYKPGVISTGTHNLTVALHNLRNNGNTIFDLDTVTITDTFVSYNTKSAQFIGGNRTIYPGQGAMLSFDWSGDAMGNTNHHVTSVWTTAFDLNYLYDVTQG